MFCDNDACDLNKYKVDPLCDSLRVSKYDECGWVGDKTIRHHKYRNRNGRVMYLCDTCNAAVQLYLGKNG